MNSTNLHARLGLGSQAREAAAQATVGDLGSMPVFWVYADYEGRWCLRKEGGEIEAKFTTRSAAITRLNELVEGASSYRAFIAKTDGRMIQKMRNVGGARGRRPCVAQIV